MKNIQTFLTELSKNNHRDWFQSNKARFDEVRAEFLDFVSSVIHDIARFDNRLAGLEAKDALFRIYRDVRFSRDKTPYKTHFGAYMASGGRKSRDAGYYMHISPEEFFIAGGSHSPDKENLKVIRQEILFRPDEYVQITDDLKTAGYVQMSSDRLKNGPADFPKDSPHIELIKDKHYIFSKIIELSDKGANELRSEVSEQFKGFYPLTTFLNSAMAFTGNE